MCVRTIPPTDRIVVKDDIVLEVSRFEDIIIENITESPSLNCNTSDGGNMGLSAPFSGITPIDVAKSPSAHS